MWFFSINTELSIPGCRLLDSDFCFIPSWLCGLDQVTQPLWAGVTSPVDGDKDSPSWAPWVGYTHECSKHAVSTEHKTGPQPRGHAAPGGAATLPLRVKQTYDTPEEPLQGLPWWLSGKESACQCRRHSYDPWSRKIPHAAEQLSLWAITTEPVLQSLGAAARRHCNKMPVCHN